MQFRTGLNLQHSSLIYVPNRNKRGRFQTEVQRGLMFSGLRLAH